MCTVSWAAEDDGYDLFFNRDEMITRGIAEPPSRFERNGVAFLAPIDSDAGGSWIGVNEFGLAVCLMNGYGSFPARSGFFVSRGFLVLDMMDCDSQESIEERLAKTILASYRAFTLVAIESGKGVLTCDWDGTRVNVNRDAVCPLISSSIQFPKILEHRKQQFANLPEQGAEFLCKFHRSHEPERGPLSVCTHRGDASTVSLSHLRVAEKSIDYFYTPGAPCQYDFLPPVSLARIR